LPKRTDLKKILLIGSGPIIIGQAVEFDYSGSQACKALKEEGYQVVLVNSNPATIMTDPEMADRTYIEPLTLEVLKKIVAAERPDAILPTLGGQTALNLTTFLHREGVLQEYGVEVLGASPEAIARAEDRDLFRQSMTEIGIAYPQSGVAHSVEEAMDIARQLGFPLILRPAFTLGGTGGGVVYNLEELKEQALAAIEASPVGQVLVEESVLGWKEIEFEVIRDHKDNVIIVTSMENIDPMGVHTGDSMVVAPAQTLSAPELQQLKEMCHRIIRKIGVTGGVNVQFAVNPESFQVRIIEVNPRLSRSSALASKATGYPIARVATKLAVGYTLDEVTNQITGGTSCFYEPALDYCVFKISRFTFEKFPDADPTLTTSMKAVGEAMSIGRNFKEALQKALRSLETGRGGFGADGKDPDLASLSRELIEEKLRFPNDQRIFYIRYALQKGFTVEEINRYTRIDPWFLYQMQEILELEEKLTLYRGSLEKLPPVLFRQAKEAGFSDHQLACILGSDELTVRRRRQELQIYPSYKLVDTCAGEFFAARPYFYSTYQPSLDESRVSNKKKVIILGGGPNRIGQGIEFDYCCVHASYFLKELGYESVIINSNPETVSTDFDTSHRLYFEPLTREDVLNIIEREQPEGVIVQFGGQTPLSLAVPLEEAGVKILGTTPDSIDRAEDRERFNALLQKLNLIKPENGTATSAEGAKEVAARIGYPVLVRPSYVLGGRAMQICHDESELAQYIGSAVDASQDHPLLVEKFLEDAIEVDVDAVADGETVVIGGIMEHIEEAGVHSGDSASVLPPHTLSEEQLERIKNYTRALALELKVRGLMNVQYAIRNDVIYVLEVNPRASRTVPFVSKAIGAPLAKIATGVIMGRSLKELGFTEERQVNHFAVKESVFPFNRFPGVDAVLGPEMKSTGEVMGIDYSYGMAFAKSQLAANQHLPLGGTAFISVRNQDKRAAVLLAKRLADLGFKLVATRGTARALRQNDLEVTEVHKVHEGRPHVIDLIKNGQIQLIINTTSGSKTSKDLRTIRSYAVTHGITLITTISGAQASVNGIEILKKRNLEVRALQDFHA